MKAYAQAIDLRNDPAVIKQYTEYHRRVWPEVLQGLKSIGIRKMKIFLLDAHLFMYFEAPDDFVPERDFMAFQQTERAREWERLMRGFQQRVPTAKPGDWWTQMECVFDLEAQ